MRRIILPAEWMCPRCEQVKPASAFAKYHHVCRQCYATSPERRRKHNLRRNYNLTPQEYNALLEKQDGLCAACGREETVFDIRMNALMKLAVDHDHETGIVRGLLCQSCNTALGLLEEDYNRVLAMLDYVVKIKSS